MSSLNRLLFGAPESAPASSPGIFPQRADIERRAVSGERPRRVERLPPPPPPQTEEEKAKTRWHPLTLTCKIRVDRTEDEKSVAPFRELIDGLKLSDFVPRPEITMQSLIGDVHVSFLNPAYYALMLYVAVGKDYINQFPRTEFGPTPEASGNVYVPERTMAMSAPVRVRAIESAEVRPSWLARTCPDDSLETVRRYQEGLGGGVVFVKGNHPTVCWLEEHRHKKLHELHRGDEGRIDEALREEWRSTYDNERDPRRRENVQMPKQLFEQAATAIIRNNAMNLTLESFLRHLTVTVRRFMPAPGVPIPLDPELRDLGKRMLDADIVTDGNVITLRISLRVLEVLR